MTSLARLGFFVLCLFSVSLSAADEEKICCEYPDRFFRLETQKHCSQMRGSERNLSRCDSAMSCCLMSLNSTTKRPDAYNDNNTGYYNLGAEACYLYRGRIVEDRKCTSRKICCGKDGIFSYQFARDCRTMGLTEIENSKPCDLAESRICCNSQGDFFFENYLVCKNFKGKVQLNGDRCAQQARKDRR